MIVSTQHHFDVWFHCGVISVVQVVSLSDFHHLLLRRRERLTMTGFRKEQLPMYPHDDKSSSSDLPTDQDTIQVHVENQKLWLVETSVTLAVIGC